MINHAYKDLNARSYRKVLGKVDLNNGSTNPTFLPTDNLQEVVISRTGEKGKFFGFGICQQATVKVIDRVGKGLPISKGNTFTVSFKAENEVITVKTWKRVCPTFHVKNSQHDEKTNTYTLTAYDALDSATSHLFSELVLSTPYTIADVLEAIRSLLGLSGKDFPSGFTTSYEKGANFGGDENIRTVLNAIAEATQTVYFVDHRDYLVFRRLDKSGSAVLDINKQQYFELTTAIPATLSKIVSVTELGNNVFEGDDTGVTQYVRDNPFWNTRTDLDTLLDTAMANIKGLTIVPFNIRWRGNFLTEIGDKINIETKDGKLITTYNLDDSFTYNGGFNQTCGWEYNPDSEKTTAAQPATLGEKLNQTFAKVDKIEKKITLYVEDVVTEVLPEKIDEIFDEKIGDSLEGIEGDIADLKATTATHTQNIGQLTVTAQGINQEVSSVKNSITTITNELGEVVDTLESTQSDVGQLQVKSNQIVASVSSVESKVKDVEGEIDDAVDAANARIDSVSKEVSMKLDKTSVEIAINQKLENGVDKVVTSAKKYTFDDTGLNISSSQSNISTQILEDGMRIKKNSQEVLTVNNQGVKAQDLHAYTFLIIGDNSRLEDRGNRTGCFWIGKVEV
jgi:hypothetical protein